MKLLDDVIQSNSENTSRILDHASGYVVSDNTTTSVAATSFDNTTAQAICKYVNGRFVKAAQSAVRDLDSSNKMCYLRVGTRKFEYLIAPEDIFTITVVQ